MTNEELVKIMAEKRARWGFASPEEHCREQEARIRAREEELARYREESRLRHLHFRRMEQNIALFWETPGLYVFDPEGRISSKELYQLYKQWCIQEKIPLRPEREFFLYTKKNASRLCLTHSTHIPCGQGKRLRGFRGVRSPGPGEASGTDGTHNG